jgi:MbtH protein
MQTFPPANVNFAMATDEDDTRTYRVLVNHEEQYSPWLARKPIPDGWRDAGKERSNTECLAFGEANWTDMRPLSLRQAMAADAEHVAHSDTSNAES